MGNRPAMVPWLITVYESSPYVEMNNQIKTVEIFIEEGKTPVEWFIEDMHKEESQQISWALINFWKV